ncbi:MAG: tRNA1(Val) (adenine(37)-N6)-methyltransferase [Lacibacter sp.]
MVISTTVTSMANTYFQFKQFEIQQQHAAMKVSTDSCLFGAWVAARAAASFSCAHRVLDIGTGTGLLMALLAQQCDATIDGIEIEATTAAEAAANCRRTPWHNRLRVLHADVRNQKVAQAYDLVISNPPFYENSLPSESAVHNVAHHGAALTLQQLVAFVAEALNNDGSFAVLLPFFREAEMVALCADKNLQLQQRTRVRHAPGKPFMRSMLWFVKGSTSLIADTDMSIHAATGKYSEDFIQLLQPYYLYL